MFEDYPDSFDADKLIFDEIQSIVKRFSIATIIETGTRKGFTTDAFASFCEKVITIESDTNHIIFAKENMRNKNAILIQGKSEKVLPCLVDKFKNERVLYYLDAHGESFCPLWSELEAIVHCQIKPVIAIHDFVCPVNPNLGYDTWNGKPLSFENVKKEVINIYGDDGYVHYTNTEMSGHGRGIGYFLPKV